jgi:hypothetical protein
MTESLRKQGSNFARALATLGGWCVGVTSNNPNVRSDKYKQMLDYMLGSSRHVRKAAKAVLADNIHGIWVQLVDDFSMQREEYTPENVVLCVF